MRVVCGQVSAADEGCCLIRRVGRALLPQKRRQNHRVEKGPSGVCHVAGVKKAPKRIRHCPELGQQQRHHRPGRVVHPVESVRERHLLLPVGSGVFPSIVGAWRTVEELHVN